MLEPHSAVCNNLYDITIDIIDYDSIIYDITELIEQCPSLCSILCLGRWLSVCLHEALTKFGMHCKECEICLSECENDLQTVGLTMEV